ncbi:MAG TPA: GxxExxY protein [Bacteroidetes bacterium]|nr:GxxExxY protein [Bacteroidota bacterium]
MGKLIFKDEVYSVVGCAMEVYNQLGNGFLEAVYQEAFELELSDRTIPFESQKLLPICYKSRKLKKQYKADLVISGSIIVELKAQSRLTSNDLSQMINYLNAAQLPLGILINVGADKNLEWKRVVLSTQK